MNETTHPMDDKENLENGASSSLASLAAAAVAAAPVTPRLWPPFTVMPGEPEVTSLRDKVGELTEENQTLKIEVASLKKRLAEAAAAGAPPSKKSRTAGQKKKLFEKWSKALMRESKKHKVFYDMCAPDAYNITIKDTNLWTQTEFHDLFDGHGEKIQPLPDNKPTSVITVVLFRGFKNVDSLFEDVGGGANINETGYEVQLWRKKRFGGCYKYDTADARMHEMEIRYNKSKQTLSLVFSMVYGGLLEKWTASSVSGSYDESE
jgi:hypothetical protein